MSVLEQKFVKAFITLCEDGWNKGWHERNGGNLSYRIKSSEIEAIKGELRTDGEWREIGTDVPRLANEYFLITGTGKFMQNVSRFPEDSIGMIELDADGKKYRVVWGLEDGGLPTSELPTHLMNHEIKKAAGEYRVIYHAHPVNVIALTFVLPLKDEVFTRELWETMTECPVIFPEGIGVVPWMVPGGREIAVETSRLMNEYDAVIWAHHGIFCAGKTFDTTFGLLHAIEKAAEILVKIKSMAPRRLQTIEVEDFRKLGKAFHVALPERFLFE